MQGQTARQTIRQAEGQIDGWTDRQTDRQTETGQIDLSVCNGSADTVRTH